MRKRSVACDLDWVCGTVVTEPRCGMASLFEPGLKCFNRKERSKEKKDRLSTHLPFASLRSRFVPFGSKFDLVVGSVSLTQVGR